jgi:hypothetical protein
MGPLRLTFVIVLCVAGALFLAACGGDDSPEQVITVPTETTGTETTEGALSKTDFIAQADPICEEANTQIQAFADAGQGLTEADEIAKLRSGVVSQLNALGPPAEDKETLDQFLAAMEATAAAGEKIALANERGTDTAQFESELQTAKDQAATAGSAYGFQSCGSDVTSSSSSTDSSGTVAPTEPAPTAPAPAPSGGSTGTGGGTGGDTGGDTGGVGTGGGVSPG